MRITQGMVTSTLLENISNNQRQLEESQNRIASGKRVRRPADDPVAVSQALDLKGEIREMEQYRRNIAGARSWLQATEVAMNDLGLVVQRARELALAAGNDALSSAQRANIAAETQQLFEGLLDLGNTKHGGRFLFAGFQVATKPFQPAANPQGYVYLGDGGQIRQEVEPNTATVVNTPGNVLFASGLSAIKALLDGLTASNGTQIRASVSSLDSAMDEVLAQRAGVGAKEERLVAADERLQDMLVETQRQLSGAVDADMAQAVVELTTRQTVYDASLRAGAHAMQPSLLDYLR